MQEQLPSSVEVSVMEMGRFLLLQNLHFRHPWRSAKGPNHSVGLTETTGNGKTSVNQTLAYKIPKRLIYEAYKRVKANQGRSGIDGQSLQDFEQNLRNNLYKLWNRLSSGSYFPQAVKGWTSRKRTGAHVHWGFQRLQAGLPKWR